MTPVGSAAVVGALMMVGVGAARSAAVALPRWAAVARVSDAQVSETRPPGPLAWLVRSVCSGGDRVNAWVSDRRGVERELPVAVDLMAASVRSGHGVLDALQVAGAGVGGGIGLDVDRLVRRIDSGATIAEALERWALERDGTGVTSLVITCRVGASMGSGLAEALDALASSLEAEAGLDGQRRSASMQALTSAVVMVSLPPVVALSGFGRLMSSGAGLLALVVASALDLLGAAWMWKMVRATL